MSSSSGPLSEELQCSVCLDVFTDPVTTPCGHNYCLTCLNKCWDNSETFSCPNCNETFKQRPDLKINTTLREISDRYKIKSPEKDLLLTDVLCDFCEDRKLKAVKSCLVCQSSYCETHLQPHLKVTGLKKHKLMHPVSNLEDYICQTHQRPLELFCRDDQTCVCAMCAVTDHQYHKIVSLEEESKEIKMKIQNQVQQMIQERIKKIQEIKHSEEARRRNTEEEKIAHVELFTDLIHSIETSKKELLELMDKQQKAAEEQDSERMSALEQEISELESRNTELEQLSHTEDHLHLIQVYSSLSTFGNTRNKSEISTKIHGTLRRALTELQSSIDEKLKKTVSEELKWMQQYAVDVTLDPDTAHPDLNLSGDGKQVRNEEIRKKLPYSPKRFTFCPNVLGKEGFSSGRFYFEVQVKGKTEWELGVARESIRRKGQISLSPEDGYWTMWLRNKSQYAALTCPIVSLSLRVKPQRVGVFVDYEEGLVCFYDVESKSHIYSYTDQLFTGKLYPYFSPSLKFKGVNSAPLIITPISDNR